MSGYQSWQGLPGAGSGIQCFPFAAGWLVRGGMGGGLIYVPDPDQQVASADARATAAALTKLQATADAILATLKQETKHMAAIDDEIAELTASVAAEGTAEASAVTLLNGIAAQITAAVQAAGAQGATPEQLAAIQAVNATVQAQTSALAAAVAAQAPTAAPPVEPPPPAA